MKRLALVSIEQLEGSGFIMKYLNNEMNRTEDRTQLLVCYVCKRREHTG